MQSRPITRQYASLRRAFNTRSMLLYLLLALLAYVAYKIHKARTYFPTWGVPEVHGLPWIGTMFATMYPRRRHINYVFIDMYKANKGAKYYGSMSFGKPLIYIRDVELVKSVLVKNFDHFADRKTFVDENTDPLFGQNLNFLNGDRWKQIRNTLSPAFTSSKMRQMFALMSKCADNFARGFVEKYEGAGEIDMRDAVSRYTCDVIATCAFGIEIDSLRNPENEFYYHGQKSNFFKGWALTKLMLEIMFPNLSRKLGLRIVSKETTDFFLRVVDETIRTREEKGIYRPDMLQLMMEARKNCSENNAAKFDLIEITAQAFVFFLAGFEATTVSTCLMFQEIVSNPDIYAKVQAEVDAVMKDGQVSYEDINNNMPYVDAVLSETLRRHPLAHVNRQCSKEFELPPAVPGAKPYKLTPGMNIFVPICGIHMDPEIHENPEKFDPDRFIGKKITIADVTNLAFGLGPRMCIGNRFGILEIKTLLVYLFSKCRLEPCKKTCLPIEYDWTAFFPIPNGGFWLKMKDDREKVGGN